jgi:hypothetical protein
MLNLLLFFLIFNGPSALAINYFRCDTSQDCAKAYGGCGRYFSVHRRYKELYEAKAHKGDRTSFCLPPKDIDNEYKYQGVPSCRKNRCLLTLSKQKSSEKQL